MSAIVCIFEIIATASTFQRREGKVTYESALAICVRICFQPLKQCEVNLKAVCIKLYGMQFVAKEGRIGTLIEMLVDCVLACLTRVGEGVVKL